MKRLLLVPAMLLAAIAAAVVTHRDQTRAVWTSLTGVPASALVTALVLVLCQVGLQAVRLWTILPRDAPLTLGRVAHAFTLGEWANIFAPARAGDALKVALLNRAPAPRALSLTQATGAVLADKVVDAGSLVLLCGSMGVSTLVSTGMRIHVPDPAIVAGVSSLLLLLWLSYRCAPPKWLERLAAWQRELVRGLAALKDPLRVVASSGCSLGAWIAEVLALRVLCGALGAPLPLPLIVLALGALNVGISIPVGVANLGVYETALALGLEHGGAPLASAVAIASLHHLLELGGINIAAAVLSLTVPSRNGRPIWSWGRQTLS